MIKKGLMLFCIGFCITFIVLSTLTEAQNKIKIEIPESFSAEGRVTFKVSLYDPQNNLINANVSVTIEDAEKITRIEKMVPSDKLTDINLGENPRAGLWTINVKYQEPSTNEITEITESFTVESNEEIKFEIIGDKLRVINIGNTRYIRTIDIKIGDAVGTKRVDLDIGKETSFRLIAPDGTYNIRVTDGKTTITKSNVLLTGKVVGILDEKLTAGGSPLTGGIKPEDSGIADESFYSTLKNKKFIYVFLLVVIGAAVLLAIERNYRKKM